MTPAVETCAGLHARSTGHQLTTLGPKIYWLIVIHLDLVCQTGKQQQKQRHWPCLMTPGGMMGGGSGVVDHKDRRGTLVCHVSNWEGDQQNQSPSFLGSCSSALTKLQLKVFLVGFNLKAGGDCYHLKKDPKQKKKLEDVKGKQEASASLIRTDPAVATVLSGLDCTFTLTEENTTV